MAAQDDFSFSKPVIREGACFHVGLKVAGCFLVVGLFVVLSRRWFWFFSRATQRGQVSVKGSWRETLTLYLSFES